MLKKFNHFDRNDIITDNSALSSNHIMKKQAYHLKTSAIRVLAACNIRGMPEQLHAGPYSFRGNRDKSYQAALTL